MVRRGIVIEEYEDIMKAPPDGPPDTGAPKPPGMTSGAVDIAEKKGGAPDKPEGASTDKKQSPAQSAATAEEKKTDAPPSQAVK
jgi:hypothetical protein